MAFTREPSARRASTMGEDSSTRRPTRETMRSMICIRCDVVFEGQAWSARACRRFSDVDAVVAIDQNVGDVVDL